MDEDDTFAKLKRAPFSEVWNRWQLLAPGTFDNMMGGYGWTYKEFDAEARRLGKWPFNQWEPTTPSGQMI